MTPFLQGLAADRSLRAARRARVAEHPTLTGLERVEAVAAGPARFDVDLHFVASQRPAKDAVPEPLAPGDVTIRSPRPGAAAHAARALERRGDAVVRAVFDPAAVLEEGLRPEALTVELRAGPHLDPLLRTGVLALAPAPAVPDPAHPADPEPTDVDYLARDYDGYRQLMLDRMATLLPGWTERHAADLGVTIVETLAYAADQLAYYQDAVATEAYLSTARRRTSVRRHARLLGYRLHEGCAARVWVRLQVSGAGVVRRGLPLVCAFEAQSVAAIAPRRAWGAGYGSSPLTTFETLADVMVTPRHAVLRLHDWGARDYALPAGSTTAMLRGRFPQLKHGDVLVFAAVADPLTGEPLAAPARRHAVRLSRRPRPFDDPLAGHALTEVSWAAEDALPFALPVCADVAGRRLHDLAEAWGNIAPADAGLTVDGPDGLVPDGADRDGLDGGDPGHPATAGLGGGAPGLDLPHDDVIYAVPYDDAADRARPAARFTAPDPREAEPQVTLAEADGAAWRPARDLVGAGRFARRFVAETEEDGSTRLRFGDGRAGRRPSPGRPLSLRCRVGRMSLNVGAESLVAWTPRDDEGDALVVGVSNPMPAVGGVEREPLEQARIEAPQAFRRQLRCVIPEDYADAALELPGVLDAVAHERRVGGRGLMVVRVLPAGGGEPSTELLREVTAYLEARRLIGLRFQVRPPRFAPLDLRLALDVASPRAPADARRGAADRVRDLLRAGERRFGGSLAAGPICAAALREEGVVDVHVHRLRRLGSDAQAGPAEDRLVLEPWEVAQLDDVATAAGRGVLQVEAWAA